jgi:putative spermidine/putrescine transport system ATP-binding protein
MSLVLEHLTKRYGQTAAVDDLSLEVGPGEFVALLGPSGCGKTTTLRMIAGFIEPSAGRIVLNGTDLTRVPAHRRNIGLVFQNYALFPHMTVRGNVEFGLRCHGATAALRRERVGQALELVGLQALAERMPKQLSGGQQQRVALARALALRPALLLFDEPLSNLDARLRVQMRRDIRALQQEVGIAAIFVTHDQEEAMAMADRIALLDQGRLVQVGVPAEVYDRPASRFAAEFIGTANCIPGHMTAVGFACAFGVLPIPGPAIAQGPALAALRPERVVLGASGLAGQITAVVTLGGIIETLVRLPDGTVITVHEPNGPPASLRQAGEPIHVSFSPGDLRFLSH